MDTAAPHIQAAARELSAGRHDAALKACHFQEHPRQPEGLAEQAIEDYRAVLAIDPATSAAWNNLGSTLLAAGRAGEAIEVLQQALVISPETLSLTLNLVNTLSHAVATLPLISLPSHATVFER